MLQLEGIYKSIYAKRILEDVSFSAHPGKITGLLGPNGAGKTTLIRIINGIIQPDSGFITKSGKPLRQKDIAEIGYLPEERGLYKSMTVAEHAIFFARIRGRNKQEAKQSLHYWLEKFNIQDWRDKRIEELSKGMAQKIQFICTLIHDPEWIILDEPFSGFDPLNVELIRNELMELKKKGKTIMISTHNMKSVEEICDDAVLIHQGKKWLEGNVYDLRNKRKNGLYLVTFEGNMLALANALWTGFELIHKEELAPSKFKAWIKLRGESTFADLLQTLMPHITLYSAQEVIPSMEEIFIQSVKQQKETTHE